MALNLFRRLVVWGSFGLPLRFRFAVTVAAFLSLFFWALVPSVYGQDGTPIPWHLQGHSILNSCDDKKGGGSGDRDFVLDKPSRCECRYHIHERMLEQYSKFPLRPGKSPTWEKGDYKGRNDYKLDDYDLWRMEEWQHMCSRLDLINATRHVTRGLALALTGLVGISFVWSIVHFMQESVAGGQVVQARNKIFRVAVGFLVFGGAWVIYETLLVSLFGTSSFTPGSFSGVGGLVYFDGVDWEY